MTSATPCHNQPKQTLTSGDLYLIKYGGAAMEDPATREAVCREVAHLAQQGIRLVVVHGGGKEISRMMERVGLTPTFIGGLRVTDADAMSITEMVLTGAVNSDLVSRITRCGAQAVGLSGRDANLLTARKLAGKAGEDLGLTGEVLETDLTCVEALLKASLVPVVSPVGESSDGVALNLNADYAAAALAGALGASRCIFLTDVPGVKKHGAVLAQLTVDDVNALIADGTISGGMIPKVECALKALQAGCLEAIICNAALPGVITTAINSNEPPGTKISVQKA
jgi:acetylglutamate kinase